MSRRKWMLAVLSGFIFAPMALAQQAGLSGSYRAEGRNPDGSAYSGRAVISEAAGGVQITWTIGSQSYSGTGRRDGQVVVVNWGQPAPVIYVVMSDGSLHGTWQNGTALERLTRE